MRIDATSLTGPLDALLGPHLQRQRWYGATDRLLRSAEVSRIDVWREEWPVLAWALVDVGYEGGAGARYQLFIGARLREADRIPLPGRDEAVLGEFDTDDGPALLFDALADPELAATVARRILSGFEVNRVRLIDTDDEASTSVVLDEARLLKVFRRVRSGPNPDIEMTEALSRVGFPHVVVPRARWNSEGIDLAVVRDLPAAGEPGDLLARASVEDLLRSRRQPADAGQDFTREARRLGQLTGAMHVASAQAFGVESADADAWADAMVQRLKLISSDALDLQRIEAAYERFRVAEDLGVSVRVHGDYRLARTLRSAGDWYVFDFEGERGRPSEGRLRRWSPLRDVAAMIRSFNSVTEAVLSDLSEPEDTELEVLAEAWLERNTRALVEGYVCVDGVRALLPTGPGSQDALLTVHELDTAVFDLGYELACRPQSVDIPLEAVNRLLGPAT